jgi:hypothetical protein
MPALGCKPKARHRSCWSSRVLSDSEASSTSTRFRSGPIVSNVAAIIRDRRVPEFRAIRVLGALGAEYRGTSKAGPSGQATPAPAGRAFVVNLTARGRSVELFARRAGPFPFGDLTTGVAPCPWAEFQVTESVCDRSGTA